MNELVTELEKSEQKPENWISSTASSAGAACHEAGDEVASAMKRGGDLCRTVGMRVGKDMQTANAVMHQNPYPVILAGIGVGALIGFFLSFKVNGRCG